MKKHVVKLTEDQKKELQKILQKGGTTASVRNRAQILLLSDEGRTDGDIAEVMFMSWRAIAGIRRRYGEEGFECALYDKPRSGRPKVYEVNHEVELTAIACTDPPEGRVKWTLELLQKEMQKKKGCEEIARNTIRLMLKKTNVNPGSKKCGV